MFTTYVRKLTPAEEARREVANLEDDAEEALGTVDAEEALGAEKSRGASTWRPVRRATMTSQAVPPSMAAGPVIERRADGPLKSVDCRHALVGEDSKPDFRIGRKIGVEGVLL
jgi:hypothetical protein